LVVKPDFLEEIAEFFPAYIRRDCSLARQGGKICSLDQLRAMSHKRANYQSISL
jgi:hypothetical protein